MKPRYPVFIPSKGRASNLQTAKLLDRDGVDYRVVVEPSQVAAYAKAGYEKKLLVLPEDGKGLVYSRNWITARSRKRGDARHWQIDDDCGAVYRVFKGHRIQCEAGPALAASEDFADRYENVAMLSFNSLNFVPITGGGPARGQNIPPFYLNHRCYTWILFLNSVPYDWRGRYNEDADMTLQVLAGGWCTVLLNAFLMRTPATMTMSGGQTDIMYAGDGRLKMARSLERAWPGVVTLGRRFGHPQHMVKNNWQKFDNKLKLRPGVELGRLKPNEYGMKLKVLRKPHHRLIQELARHA